MRIPPEKIPLAALAANRAERKIVFGDHLVFAWSGATPGAQYKIKVAFLSDSKDRTMRVEWNGRPLAENLSLPKWKVLEREWLVPAGTIANGDITVAISRISGANIGRAA